mgnify:CR=1 FL=1
MAINSSKVDEEQKEVLKSATIRRLFSYLKNYKRQVAVVLVVLAVTIAISTVNPSTPSTSILRRKTGAGLLPSAYSWL